MMNSGEPNHEFDELCARILMWVARADGKILAAETALITDFFTDELKVDSSRVRQIQELIIKLIHIDGPRVSREELSVLPPGVRELVFDYGVRVAVVDGDLAGQERQRLLQLCEELGFSDDHFHAVLRQSTRQARDAFSILELPPTATWNQVQKAAETLRHRFDPTAMSALGIGFQNLALERLEQVEWAFELLGEVLNEPSEEHCSAPFPLNETPPNPLEEEEVITRGEGVDYGKLPIAEPLYSQLWRRQLTNEAQLRTYLAGTHKHFHAKTRAILEDFLRVLERLDPDDEHAIRQGLVRYTEENRPRKVPRKEDIPIFPSEMDPDSLTQFRQLETALSLLFEQDSRLWEILCHRCGLRGQIPLTLDAIGTRLGVTRERVRQIEKKGKLAIRNLLLDGSSPRLSLHPDFLAFSLSLHREVRAAANADVMLLEDFQERLSPLLKNVPIRRGILRLYLEWNGLTFENFDSSRTLIFRHQNSANRKEFAKYLSQLEAFLSRSPRELSLDDLPTLPRLEGFLLHLEELLKLVDVELEWLDDDTFQVPLGYLRSRPDQAERVLREAGEGLDFREIGRRIRDASDNDDLNDANMRNQMISDERFKPVGRSGVWILAEWTHLTTATIPELLKEILSDSEEGLTVEEIFEKIQLLRPCSENSIGLIISSDPHFLRIGPDRYTYQPGATLAQDWNREGLGVLIEDFFQDHVDSLVPFTKLREALMTRVDVGERRLRLLLAHHPALSTHRDAAGKTYAIFQENWRESSAKKRRIRRGPGLQERVDLLLKETLSESPSEALIDVVTFCSGELGSPNSSLYAYISNSPVCEAFEDAGVKRLRLVSTQTSTPTTVGSSKKRG